MTAALVCTSHSPLMYCYARPPACHVETERLFAERQAAIRAFDPELVVVFGTDHFNGFFLDLVPPFCAGLKCTAVADIGGFPGPLDVPAEEALAYIASVRTAGVDLAVSYNMTVDHGFSQTIHRMLGALDAYPVIPIYVNGIAPPFVPFRRSRRLGEAIGRFAASRGKRVLFLASGGMSHNPTRYYPDFGSGDSRVTAYQLSGGKSVGQVEGQAGGMSHAEWLDRLDVMHREGAQMLVDGTRSRADIKLNPELDQRLLGIFTGGDLERIDALDPVRMVAEAGIGSLEIHTWVAAVAAFRAAGGGLPTVDLYSEALEYGIAFGMLQGGLARTERPA